MEDQNMELKSLSIHKKHFLKQLTKLALSLSLFSILLSTWIIPSHLSAIFSFNPFDYQIWGFLLRLLTHGADKNHIFLLCNGILVFLAKSSGLIGESFGRRCRGSTAGMECLWTNDEGGWRTPELNDVGVLIFENETISVEEAREDSTGNDNKDEDGEEIKEVCQCCCDERGEEQAVNADLGIRVEESKGETEFDEDEDCIFETGSWHGKMTAEELNRKFDEFIRRIREEISIGSAHLQQQQQPVLG